MAEVLSELQAEIEEIKRGHDAIVASVREEKDAEINRLRNENEALKVSNQLEIDAAEIRGAKSILDHFRGFFGIT